MADAFEAIEAIFRLAQEHDNDQTASLLVELSQSKPFRDRCRYAKIVAGFRGHSGTESSGREQPCGWVAHCHNCGMLLKVPRDVGKHDAIEGRAIEFDCPATGHR